MQLNQIVVDGEVYQKGFVADYQINPLAPNLNVLTGLAYSFGGAATRQMIATYKLSLQRYKEAQANGGIHPTLKVKIPYKPYIPAIVTVEVVAEAITEKLAKIGKGLVLATTPTTPGYADHGALLKSLGFRLVAGKCYRNAGYRGSGYDSPSSSLPKGFMPANDYYNHWIHLWALDLGGVEELGEPIIPTNQLGVDSLGKKFDYRARMSFPSCCGVRWRVGSFKEIPEASTNYLQVAILPASEMFPKGWKRFAKYKDYKVGINWTHPSMTTVQDCPHNFDIKLFE